MKKYPRWFIGHQSRENPSEKYEYKHYNFIKILPGIHLNPKELSALFSGPPIRQCELALGLLKQLEELKQNRLVHRDLNPENVLIDPETMEINFIDLEFCVPVDKDGFWYGPDIADAIPTNNHAVQCSRPAVIWRKNYFGTRADYGSAFVARTMFLLTSCRYKQKVLLIFARRF